MATLPTTDDLAKYYSNLLIAQYGSLPNAKATIRLLAKEAVGDDNPIFLKMREAFDLEVAVGDQLDAIGLLLGVKRYIYGTDTTKTYMGWPNYGDTFNNFHGFMRYAAVPGAGDPPTTGYYWQRYADLAAYIGELDDGVFRRLLKYIILLHQFDGTVLYADWLLSPLAYRTAPDGGTKNTTTWFAPSINIWGSVNNPVYVTETGAMAITYTISANQTGPGLNNAALISAIKTLNAWPRPAGVAVTIVG